VVSVVARAGELDQVQVALDLHRLGDRRDRRQAEPRRDLALRHGAAVGQARLLGMVEDQLVEGARVAERAA